ncbi:MAG: hypothetical protein ACTSWN_15960 [Promethearchaeota archaeon]
MGNNVDTPATSRIINRTKKAGWKNKLMNDGRKPATRKNGKSRGKNNACANNVGKTCRMSGEDRWRKMAPVFQLSCFLLSWHFLFWAGILTYFIVVQV